MVGFAIVYRNSTFLYVAGRDDRAAAAFSVGMRWSQKRGVRKRAAEEARRYAKYLRERDARAGRGGRASARRAGSGCTRSPAGCGRCWSSASTSGSAAPTTATSCTCARDRQRAARPRRRARPRHEPARRVPGAVAAGGAQARRAARDAARRGGRGRSRRGRRARRHRRPRPRPRVGAHADDPARRLARAARPAAADRLRSRRTRSRGSGGSGCRTSASTRTCPAAS